MKGSTTAYDRGEKLYGNQDYCPALISELHFFPLNVSCPLLYRFRVATETDHPTTSLFLLLNFCVFSLDDTSGMHFINSILKNLIHVIYLVYLFSVNIIV